VSASSPEVGGGLDSDGALAVEGLAAASTGRRGGKVLCSSSYSPVSKVLVSFSSCTQERADNVLQLNVMNSRQEFETINNHVFINCFLSIYTCTHVRWRRQGVRSRTGQGRCRCLYIDDRTSLKGGYL
jgi:hypothetical protein